MQQTIVALLVIANLIWAPLVQAEIYKYVDESGKKRWTDDYSQVPQEQRSSAEQVEIEYESPYLSEESQEAPSAETTPAEGEADASNQLDTSALLAEKARLDEMYKQLVEERKELEAQKEQAKDADAQAQLSSLIEAYNQKAQKYEKLTEAYNRKVNEHNQRVGAGTQN